MNTVDLIMPKLGESIMEATILKWHKKPGDKVEMDEAVLDIATDKVDSEVPSTADGVISEILYKENEVVPIGQVIAKIETSGEASPSAENYSNQQEHEEAEIMEEVPYQPEEKNQQTMEEQVSGFIHLWF
jgi:2-oxoglutarate dehydrogenase E2 component (dihydrolipoamide succinyltransferase)